jgi:hypothetical protein
MEASCSRRTSINFQQTKLRYIPQDRILRKHLCGIFKFPIPENFSEVEMSGHIKNLPSFCISGEKCRCDGRKHLPKYKTLSLSCVWTEVWQEVAGHDSNRVRRGRVTHCNWVMLRILHALQFISQLMNATRNAVRNLVRTSSAKGSFLWLSLRESTAYVSLCIDAMHDVASRIRSQMYVESCSFG